MHTSSELFSREAVAGYDRHRLEAARVALVGCGAAGANVAQSLALSGVGEVRLIDPDHVEPSNVTRSPLFRLDRLRADRLRHKANECARAVLDLSYAASPVVRSAVAPVEDLGFGALRDCDVVIAAVDSLTVRARLADMTRALGVPMVELGFSAPRGQVSVYPNRHADEPCWRCLHPQVSYGSASCSLYARRVVAEGRIPATQALAATFAALATEAAVLAVHGEFPLGGCVLTLDIRRGVARRMELTTDPACPGVHRRFETIVPVPVRSTATVAALLDAARPWVGEPVLHLPDPFLREAPCAVCRGPVPLGRLARLVTEPPSCDGCRAGASVAQEPGDGPPLVAATRVAPEDELARWKLQRFGVRPGALLVVGDRASDREVVVALEGGPDDLYVTRRRAVDGTGAAPEDGFAACAVPRDDGFAPVA